MKYAVTIVAFLVWVWLVDGYLRVKDAGKIHSEDERNEDK